MNLQRLALALKNNTHTLLLAMLVLANAMYFTYSFFGWVVTLGFFLFVPGFLLLSRLKHDIKSPWEVASFSLALGILIIMLSGLALNSLHGFGLERPLVTPYIFATLDLVTIVLILLSRDKHLHLPGIHIHATIEQTAVSVVLSLLPLLAVGGAFRLNNGASNIITMLLFAVIPILFIYMIVRSKRLTTLYPYAVFMFGLSVLLSISLRGWHIAADDFQHELSIFQITNNANYWLITHPENDPYNACLGLTILPTVLAKITTIAPQYIYRAVFQTIFAFELIPIYFLVKRLANARLAMMGVLVFISFPPFLNAMPFLNRQEMAFVFFGLLILTTFHNMAHRPKTILTILLLLGVILSHYSSGYVALAVLIIAWMSFKLLRISVHRRSSWQPFSMPILSLPILIVALLFTFLWNMQVTNSSSNLTSTISHTIKGIWNGSSTQSGGVSYAITSPSTLSKSQILHNYAGSNASQVHYTPQTLLPTTRLGNAVSKIVGVASLNSTIRSASAKLLQVLLLIGAVVLFFRQRKTETAKETYFFALVIGCIALLVMITVLPQLSVDYGVTRLFQQTLVIIALPIIVAVEFLFGFLNRYKIYAATALFAFLFLDLSGFIPQALGGYPPQLALNNWGTDYDIYYIHQGEIDSAKWLKDNDRGRAIATDFYARNRLTFASISWERTDIITSDKTSAYVYQDYENTHNSTYGTFISGDIFEYTYPNALLNRNRIYSNQSSGVYYRPTINLASSSGD